MDKTSRPKKLLKKTRNRLFSGVYEFLTKLQAQVSDLQDRQNELASMQAAILKKVNSSGFVQISETEVMTKIFSGAKMYVDPKDIALVPHLLLDGEWEHDITQAWLTILKPKDVVLDIGANFGYFGVLAAQQTNKDCRVIMFEANPNLVSYLSKTVTVNSLDNCSQVENLAVSDKKGTITLNILKDYIASSSIHDVSTLNKYNTNGAKFELESAVQVPATTIDLYCQANQIKVVNVIKMDIEGHEDKAYAGMRGIIKASPDITMFIEFTKQAYDNPEAFYNMMLKDFGYVFQIRQNGVITKPKQSDYKSVIGDGEEWTMPIFSKNKDLAAA